MHQEYEQEDDVGERHDPVVRRRQRPRQRQQQFEDVIGVPS